MKELNSRQRRFVELVAGGMAAGRAYEQAGYKCQSKDSADQAGSRLLGNVKVQEYLAELQQEARKRALMTVQELQLYLAGAIRTPLSQIGPDNPLCHEYTKVSKDEKVSSGSEEQVEFDVGGFDEIRGDEVVVKVKKVDPLRAAGLLMQLNGWGKQNVSVEGHVSIGDVLTKVEPAAFPKANPA